LIRRHITLTLYYYIIIIIAAITLALSAFQLGYITLSTDIAMPLFSPFHTPLLMPLLAPLRCMPF